jgi:pentatricopeptide repeat protein
MMEGWLQAGRVPEARAILDSMTARGVVPTTAAVLALLRGTLRIDPSGQLHGKALRQREKGEAQCACMCVSVRMYVTVYMHVRAYICIYM